jgi:hypothetical protein
MYARHGTGNRFNPFTVDLPAQVPRQYDETIFHRDREAAQIQSADPVILPNGIPDLRQEVVIGIQKYVSAGFQFNHFSDSSIKKGIYLFFSHLQDTHLTIPRHESKVLLKCHSRMADGLFCGVFKAASRQKHCSMFVSSCFLCFVCSSK